MEKPGGSGAVKAKQRWSRLASLVESGSAREVPSGQLNLQQDTTGNRSSIHKRLSKAKRQDTSEDVSEMRERFKMRNFFSKLTSAVHNSKPPEENKPVDDGEEFIVESQRRFLFDDEAVHAASGDHATSPFLTKDQPEEDFNDVVDQDDRRIEVFVSQELVGKLLESTHFKVFIFALIVINSALIGLQTDYTLSMQYRYLFSVIEHGVLAVFICEILLKWYHGFWIFWQVGWNVLDFIIIGALLLGPQLSFLSSSRVLRILRVLRAFRSLRSISALAGLSMVVQTILQSIPDMANIVLLLTIILLMLGVAGVTLFGKHVPDRFGDLQTAMFSLFICVTQDGWVNIYKKFQHGGDWLHVGGSIFFTIAIVIGAFVFANLVVAVVVTNLEMAMKELKQEKHAMVDTLATDYHNNPDDPDTETPETVPIITFKEAQREVDFTTQKPLQLADLKGLTLNKIEQYFIVLSAMEDNLAEYVRIKADLIQMYDVIKSVNILDTATSYDDFESLKKDQRPSIDLDQLKKGDILSNLMRLEEQAIVRSDGATTMDALLKSTKQTLAKQSLRPAASSLRVDGRRGGGAGGSGRKGGRGSATSLT